VYVYGTAHVLVDVNGFYMSATAGAVDAYTKAETDTKLGTKADQTTVDELETTKADQTTVDELETTVGTKADQTTVDELETTKADQTTVDELETTVGAKADQTTVDELETTVGAKADQTTVDDDVAALRALAAAMRTPLTIDSADSVGLRSSIAVGDNGYPIISYYDATNADLKVAACTAADCTGTPTVTTIDSADDVGVHTSIAIGDNGYPVISYYDTTNADLKVAACTTADCTGTPTITTIDSADDVGWYLSIAIGNNGNPVISYHDVTNADLKVAACTAADCTGTPTVTIIDSTDGVGGYTSIAIGGNGNPVISYWDVTNDDLKVAACITADCTGTPTVTTIDSIGDVGTYTSIAIGDNGYPVISYQDLTNDDLKVAACITADCSGTPTVTTVDSDGDVGTYTSIAIGNNGYPVISYYDATNDDLKVAACSNADCSDTPTIATVDSDGDVGSYTSMAIGNNGNPIISYYDATNSALKMAAMWYLELPQ
jgi:hypothetical protein